MAQYHYPDDSGDPGMDGSEGSSSHFVLAMVQLAGNAPLPHLKSARQMLHLAPLFEFKYYKTSPVQKDVFFRSVQSLSFRVRAVIIEKANLDQRFALMSGQELTIEFISGLTLRASELDIAEDVLIIDGATPALCQTLRVKLSGECRRLERVRPFRKIVGGKSKYEDGLQLADMIAGAIRRYAMGNERNYYETFADKVVDLWEVATGKK